MNFISMYVIFMIVWLFPVVRELMSILVGCGSLSFIFLSGVP